MGLAVSYNETFSEAAFSSVFVVSGVFLLSEVCMILEHLKSFLFTFICVYECLLYIGMYVCIYVCMYKCVCVYMYVCVPYTWLLHKEVRRGRQIH